MPHGQSVFSYVFGSSYARILELAGIWFGGADHKTYYMHETVDVQHVVGSIVVIALLSTFAFLTYGKIKDASKAIVPDGTLTTRNAIEVLVGGIYSMMSDIMGPKAAKYFLPLIGTCAFFILASNAIGLIPGFGSPTGKLDTTLACALIIFFATHIFGVKEHGLAYFKHFLGPVWWLAPLMLPIELISHFARPASLSIRLMANMSADHLVVGTFLALAPWFVPVPMMLLGSIVVVVQTLVFCLLSTVYISMAIAHEDH